MQVPDEVTELLFALRTAVEDTLAALLIGIYLRGSLATGDFIPSTSDVDVLAVTERRVTETEFAALDRVHASVARSSNAYANRLEIAYIDREAVRRFQPGQRHPTLYQGGSLTWAEHQDNWLLERWFTRECGAAICGPAPSALIDPISADDLTRAIRSRLHDWRMWLTDEADGPEHHPRRGHSAYVVETMCRARCALETGALHSKPQAVAWALANFPEPWRTTVERSQHWRIDRSIDHSILPELRRFVLWATDQRA